MSPPFLASRWVSFRFQSGLEPYVLRKFIKFYDCSGWMCDCHPLALYRKRRYIREYDTDFDQYIGEDQEPLPVPLDLAACFQGQL